jgi:hypothetical protein
MVWNGYKTHCKRGHEFTPENTLLTSRGHRRCKQCTQALVKTVIDRGICVNGHVMTPENSRTDRAGRSYCVACKTKKHQVKAPKEQCSKGHQLEQEDGVCRTCQNEYAAKSRAKKRGTKPRRIRPHDVPFEDWYWSFVERKGPDECWPWLRGLDHGGYGRMKDKESNEEKSHRIAWTLTNGTVPDGLVVRHSCDNPPCCNPAHLLIGTSAENTADRDERDRQVKGSGSPQAKLTEESVRIIRRMRTYKVPYTKISAMFGVSTAAVHQASTGKSWKHVKTPYDSWSG